MKEPTYNEAIRVSWKLAWRHKGLWIFGLFAMVLGQMGIVDLFIKLGFASQSLRISNLWDVGWYVFSPRAWRGFVELFTVESWVWFIWVIVILVGLCLVFLFIAVVSQGALVHASAKFAKRLSVFPSESDSWHQGVKHFWRLLGLNIVRKLVLLAATAVVVAAIINVLFAPTLTNHFLFLFLFVFAALVGFIVSFLLIYAAGYVVVEDYRFIEAMRMAWGLFVKHWLVSLEVGLIILFMNIILLAVGLVGVIYVFFLPLLVAKLLAFVFGSMAILKIGIFLGYTLFLLFMALVGSVFTVFTTSVWTYLFMKMHKHGMKSKIMHWLWR